MSDLAVRHPEPCEGSKETDRLAPRAWILRTAQDDAAVVWPGIFKIPDYRFSVFQIPRLEDDTWDRYPMNHLAFSTRTVQVPPEARPNFSEKLPMLRAKATFSRLFR